MKFRFLLGIGIILLCFSVGTVWFLRGGQTLAPTEQQVLNTPSDLPEHSLGAANAPLILVEYASFTCGHCATFHETTYPFLKKNYIDTGKLRFILRPLPLDPVARAATLFTYCVPESQFFPLVDVLFRTQEVWAFGEDPYTGLLDIARQVGVSRPEFEACILDQKRSESLRKTETYAQEVLSVQSTPSFFLNGEKRSEALTPQELESWIAQHTTKQNTQMQESGAE